MKRVLYILSLFLMLAKSIYAAEPFEAVSDVLYASYIREDIATWGPIIKYFHRKSISSVDSLDFILSVEYGYVAWAISDTTSVDAEKLLDMAFADLEKFEKAVELIPEETVSRQRYESKYNSYYSAFLAYQLKIAPARVIINGWRCVNNAKTAITNDPNSWFSQLEYGNVMHYMPVFLGGSKINARKAYIRAIELMESDSNSRTLYHNWMYLHAILCLADCYKEEKDYDGVRECYNKVIGIEPDFKLVREKYLPSLDKIEAKGRSISSK